MADMHDIMRKVCSIMIWGDEYAVFAAAVTCNGEGASAKDFGRGLMLQMWQIQ